MSKVNNSDKGAFGEQKAVDFLVQMGYKILERNYRVGRLGEIDIIAKHCEYICFIEVKTRSSYSYGNPGEAVDRLKQRKIKNIAAIFLSKTGNSNGLVRFDVVEIKIKNKSVANEVENINLIQDAF